MIDCAGVHALMDSRRLATAQHESHRTIDPQCLENPRPVGAESTLTENAPSPFQAEPRQSFLRCGMTFDCGDVSIGIFCNVTVWINHDDPQSDAQKKLPAYYE